MNKAPLYTMDQELEIIGQMPMPIYTQICFVYSMSDASTQESIISTLTTGLKQLTASFPWIAGQIVNEGASEGNSGVYKIKALGSHPPLLTKDLTDDTSAITLEQLRTSKYPSSMLDESVIAPCNTLGGSIDGKMPVFALQATFIRGGLLLVINAHHQAMDMTGQGQMIRLLSKACRNDPFDNEDIRTGNLERRDIVPLLDTTDESVAEITTQTPPKSDTAAAPDATAAAVADAPPPAQLPTSSWTYMAVSAASIAKLKTQANATLPPSTKFVSSDDALTAFIWQATARSRSARLAASTQSMLGRAVNVRSVLNIPETYPGFIQTMTHSTGTNTTIANGPLGVTASRLRAELEPGKLGHKARELATKLSRAKDKGSVSFTGNTDVSHNLLLSSWARVRAYEWDFGLGLGSPECVRRPRFTPVESLAYLLPAAPDGGIVVMLCLRDEELEKFRGDEAVAEHVEWIG